ncbi:MAG TPA: radical SAM protein [Frankiaceae bacterium]|nr:radical SAM protein [Frankiaceae bacterium]
MVARQPATAPVPIARLFLEPEVLTILGTYKCTAACENCCFGSNPYLTERLALDDILAFIREGARYPSCKLVAFSGGECFLLGDDLVAAVAYATELGLSTRCVTNGYWAKSVSHGRRRIRELADAGLKELNVSTGDFHQRWVAQETVVNAACLGVEAGFADTLVLVELQRERRVTRRDIESDPRIAALLAGSGGRFRVLESPWMPTDLHETIAQPEHRMLSRRTLHLRGGCDSVLRTIVVTPSHRLGFCCGLTREQIPELNTDWDGGPLDPLLEVGGRDLMKIWLYVDGPERILAWAASKEPRIEWEDRYAHHCQACLALFADPLVRDTIRAHFTERVDDVLLRYLSGLRAAQAADFVPVTAKPNGS